MSRFVFLFFALAAFARAGGLALRLDEIAPYALKHHPGLVAARWRVEEARGRLVQSGRLANPELEVELTRRTGSPEGAVGVSLTQRFPVTARLRHEQAVSRAELAAAEAEIRNVERKLVAEAQALAVKIIASRGQRELRARQMQTGDELASFLRKGAGEGEASGIDAAQVELETRQLDLEVLQLSAAETALAGELQTLLGVNGEVAVVGTLPVATPPRSDSATSDRADIQVAQHRAEAAQASVQQQHASRWEDVGVGLSYSRGRQIDEPEPIETEHIIGLRVNIPLPLWNRNTGRIREAEAAAARAQNEVETTRLTARSEETSTHREMSVLARLVGTLDRQMLPQALEIEQRIRQQYESGQTPLTEVLRARSRHLDLQRQRLDALRDFHLARVRHAAALGNPTSSIR